MRVLLVEDDDVLREVLRQTLKLEDFNVSCAPNGNEAIKLARIHHFDLVITDLVMPEKEGIETIRELRELDPEIKILAMSGGQGNTSRDYLPLAKMLGAAAVLKKPFDRLTLLRTVRQLVGPEASGGT